MKNNTLIQIHELGQSVWLDFFDRKIMDTGKLKTLTKDPSFSDVKYAEGLIGKDTISTITIETLEAFRDHGQAVTHLEDGLTKAGRILTQLKKKGILEAVITSKL